MNKIDKNESFIVNIDENGVEEDYKNNNEVKVDQTFVKLIDSIIDYLVNKNINQPEKYLVFSKLMNHPNYYYSCLCDDKNDIDESIETVIKKKQKDAVEFLWLTINVSMLPKNESMKTLKDMFYCMFQFGLTINDIAMCDLTTNIYTRGYTFGPWKEYIQG